MSAALIIVRHKSQTFPGEVYHLTERWQFVAGYSFLGHEYFAASFPTYHMIGWILLLLKNITSEQLLNLENVVPSSI